VDYVFRNPVAFFRYADKVDPNALHDHLEIFENSSDADWVGAHFIYEAYSNSPLPNVYFKKLLFRETKKTKKQPKPLERPHTLSILLDILQRTAF
jgi:hypothetical protein